MSIDEKRNYLKNYRFQQVKIRRMEQMMGECPEKREKYLKIMNEASHLRDRIEDEIDEVDGGILSEILSQKYICGRSLEEIAFLMNYSKRQVERLHIKALGLFLKQ